MVGLLVRLRVDLISSRSLVISSRSSILPPYALYARALAPGSLFQLVIWKALRLSVVVWESHPWMWRGSSAGVAT